MSLKQFNLSQQIHINHSFVDESNLWLNILLYTVTNFNFPNQKLYSSSICGHSMGGCLTSGQLDFLWWNFLVRSRISKKCLNKKSIHSPIKPKFQHPQSAT